MLLQKPCHDLLIFLRQDSAGRVNQCSAGTDVGSGVLQYGPLLLRQLRQFLGRLIADIRLFADDPQAGAGYVSHHQIGLLRPCFVVLPPISQCRANGMKPQTSRTVLDQLQLVGMNIAGQDITLILHVNGQRKGFAARRGADVQHPVVALRSGHSGHQTGRGVLHREKPLPEGAEAFQIACTADLKAACHPGMGFHCRSAGTQFLLQRFRRCLQGIGLNGSGYDGVIAAQILLRLLRAQNIDQAGHQPLGMTVPQ